MAVRQKDVISRLRAGETITHVIERVGDEHKPYQHLSGGGRVTRRTYEKLRDSGDLQPVSPGLFPDAEPQEWGWSGD